MCGIAGQSSTELSSFLKSLRGLVLAVVDKSVLAASASIISRVLLVTYIFLTRFIVMSLVISILLEATHGTHTLSHVKSLVIVQAGHALLERFGVGRARKQQMHKATLQRGL